MDIEVAFKTELPNKEAEAIVIGALLKLYQRQTGSEQVSSATIEENGVGFNGTDAFILTEFAKQFSTKKFLTINQMKMAQFKLRKYLNTQILPGGVHPVENGRLPVKDEGPENKRKRKVAILTDMSISVKFPYDEATIASIKRVSGRSWSAGLRCWKLPLTLEAAEWCQKNGFEMSKSLVEYLAHAKDGHNGSSSLKVPGLRHQLFKFQEIGVGFLEAVKGRGLIADEMGLGKTVQALAWLQLHPELRPAIIVCPASVKLNWWRETNKWLPSPNATVLSGTKPWTLWGSQIAIINYDILASWLEAVKGIFPKVLVIDECHMTKNPKAQRTHAVQALASSVKHVIAMSGTPVVNRPVEFFTTLKMLRKDLFPSWRRYAEEYCGLRYNGWGWDATGATNTDDLNRKLTSTIMIRRLKKDVLKDLPPKIRSVVPMQIDNKPEYERAEEDLIEWLMETEGSEKARKASKAEHLARFEAMKQLAVRGKLLMASEWIKDYLDADGKLVVFATHHATIDQLRESLREFNPVVLDGRTPAPARQDVVDKFQNDDSCRVFIGNIRAAGIGITLTAASASAFVELGWTPGEMDQAEDRIHRIGQESDSVNIYYLLDPTTIEGEIAELLDRKRVVLTSVLDGKVVDEESMLTELIGKYTNREE